MQNRMTVGKGTTANILTRDPDRVPLVKQSRVRHHFGVAPVYRQGSGSHLFTVTDNLGDLALNTETLRQGSQLLAELLDGLQGDAGFALCGPLVSQIRSPVNIEVLVRFFYQ